MVFMSFFSDIVGISILPPTVLRKWKLCGGGSLVVYRVIKRRLA